MKRGLLGQGWNWTQVKTKQSNQVWKQPQRPAFHRKALQSGSRPPAAADMGFRWHICHRDNIHLSGDTSHHNELSPERRGDMTGPSEADRSITSRPHTLSISARSESGRCQCWMRHSNTEIQLQRTANRTFKLKLLPVCYALQWMGAVKMRGQTANKNITIIHTTPVHQLMFCEVKSYLFVRNKFISCFDSHSDGTHSLQRIQVMKCYISANLSWWRNSTLSSTNVNFCVNCSFKLNFSH